MKPCATCKYYWRSYWGDACTIYYKSEPRFNPYAGETDYWSTGNKKVKWMRSDEGDCGPDRKLYKQKLSSKLAPYFSWFVISGWIIFLSYIVYVEAGK